MFIYTAIISLFFWALANQGVGPKTNHVTAMNATQPDSSSSSSRYCDNMACEFFAQRFLSKLDTQTGPCENFYDHVCRHNSATLESLGSTTVANNIKLLVDSGNGSGNRNEDESDDDENQDANQEDSQNRVRLRNLYDSCNQPNPNNRQHLLDLIRKLGGFPLGGHMSGWNKDRKFDWLQTTVSFRELGLELDQFFQFNPEPDQTHYKFKVDVTTKHHNVDKMDSYHDIIRDLYPEQDATLIETHLMRLKLFRSNMYRTILSSRGKKYKHSLQAVTDLIPSIDWFKLYQGLTGYDSEFVTRQFGNTQFFVQDNSKLIAASELLSQTDPEILANHMMMSVIDSFAPYLSLSTDASIPTLQSFSRDIYPKPKCLEMLKRKLGLALSVEYFKTYVKHKTYKLTTNMVDAIRKEARQMVQEAGWISDPTTRSVALTKMDNMKFDIGISNKLHDPRTSESLYRGLKFESRNPIENLMSINKARHNFYLSELLDKPKDEFEWIEYDRHVSAEAQAGYYLPNHRVYIMAGLMSDIYLEDSRLASINFAIFGGVVAHEMMHAFDLQGIRFDANHLVRNWCDATSLAQYKSRVDCLRAQYNGLELNEAQWVVDGDATLLENFADNAGLQIAYRAFRSWQKSHSNQPSILKDVDMDTNQLFWASYAAVHCVTYKDQQEVDLYQNGPHSPARFRVNIPLVNDKMFSRDFQCPLDSGMNPRESCTIWN